MANMNPVRVGAAMPSDANKKGALNETTPPEQREVKLPAKLDDGPKRGDKGEFLPASYVTKAGSIRSDR